VDDSGLIAALQHPEAYSVPVGPVRVIETHISWIILTGTLAYKIKKPVNFGFLDFTRLEDRHHFCQEELRLNRRLAASLYLDCVPITGSPSHPQMAGEGEAIEYAVKMRQFDNEQLFDTLAVRNQLTVPLLERLATRLADFHRQLPPAAPDSRFGEPDSIREAALQNIDILLNARQETEDRRVLPELARWTEQACQVLSPVFQARKQQGYIRECHGDLHLGNLVLLEGEPLPFDAIEFNPDFRWIDLMSEVAFPVMDLAVHGLANPAVQTLNRYLSVTGDYDGLQVFTFYRIYRALVRAKVIQLGRNPATETAEHRSRILARYRAYVRYALDLTRSTSPRLFLTHGFSGSGKSTLAALLAAHTRAIVLRSDIERKRLHARLPSSAGLYDRAFTALTYRHLLELTHRLLGWGFTVVVDASFLARTERMYQQRQASELGVAWFIFSCTTSPARLRQRIRKRARQGLDPSDATVAVLENQRRYCDPLTDEEMAHRILIDTSTPESLQSGLENGLRCGQLDSKSAN